MFNKARLAVVIARSYPQACVLLALAQAGTAHAQSEPVDFHVGAVRMTDSAAAITIHAEPPITVTVLPGGRLQPALTLAENGDIHVGNTVLAARDGRVLARAGNDTLLLPHGVQVTPLAGAYRIVRGATRCTLSARALGLQPGQPAERGAVSFAPSRHGLVALVRRTASDVRDTSYVAARIDLHRCRATLAPLGNPDLLVELGQSSRGGWWLTGSIEQTLLQSEDGRRWRRVSLPAGLSSLVGSYVVDAREIWLAGLFGPDWESDTQLVHTADGGRHWRSLPPGDPVLARLPPGWLEGMKRRAIASPVRAGDGPPR